MQSQVDTKGQEGKKEERKTGNREYKNGSRTQAPHCDGPTSFCGRKALCVVTPTVRKVMQRDSHDNGKTHCHNGQRSGTPKDLVDVRRENEIPGSAVDRPEHGSYNDCKAEKRLHFCVQAIKYRLHDPFHVTLLEEHLEYWL